MAVPNGTGAESIHVRLSLKIRPAFFNGKRLPEPRLCLALRCSWVLTGQFCPQCGAALICHVAASTGSLFHLRLPHLCQELCGGRQMAEARGAKPNKLIAATDESAIYLDPDH
eukprot:s1132_g5.t1